MEPIDYANVIDSVLIVRSTADAKAVFPIIRFQFRSLDSQLLPAPETIDAIVGRYIEQYSVILTIASIALALSLLLCLFGVYGVAAFATAQRTREIAVHLAIGARHSDIRKLIIRSIGRPLWTGLPMGIAVGSVFSQLFIAWNFSLESPRWIWTCPQILRHPVKTKLHPMEN